MPSNKKEMLEGDGRTWSKALPGIDFTKAVTWDLMDMAKSAAGCRTALGSQKPGTSDAAEKHRVALKEDPYDLYAINELGLVYHKEAKHSQCSNVLIRGWKRVSEIEDEEVRFSFLAHLADASIRLNQHRQATAVLQDMAEPPKENRQSRLQYSRISIQAYANAGQVEKALKHFQVVLEEEDFAIAVRMFIYVQLDFFKAGAYDSVKDAMAAKAKTDKEKADVQLAESFMSKYTVSQKDAGENKRPITSITLALASVSILAMGGMMLMTTWQK